MPCNIASHQHVWPTEGILVIEKCEVYCGLCTGAAARNWHKHAWFLRRHAEGHVKNEYPNLVIDAGWDPLHPRGISFNEHREMRQQEKLASSDSKKKNNKKTQASRKLGKIPASPFDDDDDFNMDSQISTPTGLTQPYIYGMQSQMPLPQFSPMSAADGDQAHFAHPATGTAPTTSDPGADTAESDFDTELRSFLDAMASTAQNDTSGMEISEVFTGDIDFTDPFWANLDMTGELNASDESAFTTTNADGTIFTAAQIVNYLQQVVEGTGLVNDVSVSLRRQICAHLGNNRVLECMDRRDARRRAQAKEQEKSANALAYRQATTTPTPPTQSSTTSGKIGLAGLKKNRNTTLKGYLRAQATAEKNAAKEAAKEAAKAAKVAKKQGTKPTTNGQQGSVAQNGNLQMTGPHAPPYNLTYKNNVAYVNGAPLLQRRDSLFDADNQQPRVIDITGETDVVESAGAVALGRNCAVAHVGNIGAAKSGRVPMQGLAAQTFARSNTNTTTKRRPQNLQIIPVQHSDIIDPRTPTPATGYVTTLNTYTNTSTSQAPTQIQAAAVSMDQDLEDFEKLLQSNGMPSAGEMDPLYAAAQNDIENNVSQPQAFRETIGFVNPFEVNAFAANGTDLANPLMPTMLQPADICDGDEGQNDFTSATLTTNTDDDLSTLFPGLSDSDAITNDVSFDDLFDFGTEDDFTFDPTHDTIMSSVEPAKDLEGTQADDDANFFSHTQDLLSDYLSSELEF